MKRFWIVNLLATTFCLLSCYLDISDGKIDKAFMFCVDSILGTANLLIAIGNIRKNYKQKKKDKELIKIIDKL